MRHKIQKGERHVSLQPNRIVSKTTRGEFKYDFGDESGLTPLLPMYTLGHTFKPATIHAGGLRYHGAGVVLSQLMKDGYMRQLILNRTNRLKQAYCLPALRVSFLLPSHATPSQLVHEALKCKETGESKTILFNLSGHGFVDMSAYDQYLAGELQDFRLSDEELAKFMASANV